MSLDIKEVEVSVHSPPKLIAIIPFEEEQLEKEHNSRSFPFSLAQLQ